MQSQLSTPRLITALVLLSSALLGGCAVDASELSDEELGELGQAATQKTYRGYLFRGGNWTVASSTSIATSTFQTYNFQFGISSDLPVMAQMADGSAIIGTYGRATGRDGFFYVDMNQNENWEVSADRGIKFMPTPQGDDAPFLYVGPGLRKQWKNQTQWDCVPTFSPIVQVGVVRKNGTNGARWYLDANGDGIWSDISQCDAKGDFGYWTDSFVIAGTAGNSQISVSRTGGGTRSWGFDMNRDLAWSSADTWLTANFGAETDVIGSGIFSTTLRPAPYGVHAVRGRTVYADTGDRTWDQSTDLSWTNVLPDDRTRWVGLIISP